MTIFSLVVIGVLINILRKNKKTIDIFCSLFAFAASLEIMMSVGYFFKIGNFELGYSEMVIIIVTIFAIFLLVKNGKLNAERTVTGSLLILSCLISLLLAIAFPYKGTVVATEAQWDLIYFLGQSASKVQIGMSQIKEIMHLVCFVISMWVVYRLDSTRIEKLITDTFHYCKYFIWFGLIEFVVVYILRAKDALYSAEASIFGNSFFNNSGTISMGRINRLRGLKSEPSMYGYALFLFVVISLLLFLKEKKRYYLFYAIVGIVLEISSFSMTAVICLAALFFFYYMFQVYKGGTKKKLNLLTFLLVIVIATIVLLTNIYLHDSNNYFWHRMHLTLKNFENLSMTGWNGDYAGNDASTRIRLLSVVGEFGYWKSRPLFGLALGSTYAHSPFMTILASIGLVGTILWFKFVFCPSGIAGRRFTALKIGWCAMLVFAGAGLFPFYGFQNIVIYYALLEMSQEVSYEKHKNIRRISAPVSYDGIQR